MSELIYGRNPVINALTGLKKPLKILVSSTMRDNKIVLLAKTYGVKAEFVDNSLLNRLTNNRNHQGVAAYVNSFSYTDLNVLLSSLKNKPECLLLILDGIADPVNFGSMIRTSSCFGVDGIIIGKNRQVQITPTVIKVATGAEEYVSISDVVNISQTILKLKEEGFWIVTADGSGDKMYDEIDYSGKMAIVIGSEGNGAGKNVMHNSDFVVRIPISGPITSLNASISAAIMLAEVTRYRRAKIAK